jgi:hypothetical protein
VSAVVDGEYLELLCQRAETMVPVEVRGCRPTVQQHQDRSPGWSGLLAHERRAATREPDRAPERKSRPISPPDQRRHEHHITALLGPTYLASMPIDSLQKHRARGTPTGAVTVLCVWTRRALSEANP